MKKNKRYAWIITTLQWDGGSDSERYPNCAVIGTRKDAEKKASEMPTGKVDCAVEICDAALDAVIECMDGKEWSADTLQQIALVLSEHGIELRNYEGANSEDD